VYFLERAQRVPASRAQVFAFFSDPRNLVRITPPDLGFRIVEAPANISEGCRIEYRIRRFGLSLAWVTRISRWDPPREFCDVQERGPYRRWVHAHRFDEVDEGTIVRDRVEYALPLGWIGRVAHRLTVRRQLEEIFDFRRRAIEEVFRSQFSVFRSEGIPPERQLKTED
jgi:ligand-binding SRPBCC domain-containing protein